MGDYRIIYLIKDKELVILAMSIGHRRDIYEKWVICTKKILTIKG
ncbi:MAG: type II toxin-antitoxin system RelE/ParE family toxin [Firmicutes bacterium]|nr:type II toxin-antitoxin system RelE/ParE family toxin [Bacillota bacterium]